jgi:PAS domain S-box-containing protein
MLSDFVFPQSRGSHAARYLFATAVCTAAFWLRVAVDPLFREHSPLMLFTLPVAAAAVRGGLGPGIFATCLSEVLAVHFFPPQGSFFDIDPAYRSTAALQLAAFLIVGLVLSWLSGSLLDLRWKALQLANERTDILESITDGFAALDRDWRLIYLNTMAAQLMGGSKLQAIGRNLWNAVPEWAGSPVEAACRDASEGRGPVRLEYSARASNRWFEFHISSVENGAITIYFSDITGRKGTELRLRETLAERDTALKNVHMLSGLLPICAGCKKIRNQEGLWEQMERYISTHSNAEFSHGMCPDCARVYWGDIAAKILG